MDPGADTIRQPSEKPTVTFVPGHTKSAHGGTTTSSLLSFISPGLRSASRSRGGPLTAELTGCEDWMSPELETGVISYRGRCLTILVRSRVLRVARQSTSC